jgi:plastocyanin
MERVSAQSDIRILMAEITDVVGGIYRLRLSQGKVAEDVEMSQAGFRWELLEAGVWHPPEALVRAYWHPTPTFRRNGRAVSQVLGRVVWDGPVPKLPPHTNIRDAYLFGKTVPNDRLQINEKLRGVANVFVYLKKAPKGYEPDKNEKLKPVQFGLEGRSFKPRSMVVRTGQRIQFINKVATAGNVHAMPMKNSETNMVLKAGDVSGTAGREYKRAEAIPVRVTSDFHPWMRAYQLPLDHPFGTTTDSAGRFIIRGLPPGEHTLSVWHEMFGWLPEIKVTVPDADKTPNRKLYAVRISAKTKVDALKRSIAVLRERFGERHPQVVAKKKELAEWETRAAGKN